MARSPAFRCGAGSIRRRNWPISATAAFSTTSCGTSPVRPPDGLSRLREPRLDQTEINCRAMKLFERLMLVMALGAVPGVMATPVAGWAKARPKHGEAVVELFTAQGCASCKEANKLAAKLA